MLSHLIPLFLRKKFYNKVRNSILNSLKKQSSGIPKIQIPLEALNSARLLPSREVLLEYLPKGGVVAELGVDYGEFSQKILDINQPKILHLVDLWNTERYHQGKQAEVEKKFFSKIDKGQVEIHIGYSTEVVSQFPDGTFDWIYIDTDHSYATTKMELELWSAKIKSNGIIAGHDYVKGNLDGFVRYGVIEALHEFCVNYKWEIIFLTMELDVNPSFAIKRKS